MLMYIRKCKNVLCIHTHAHAHTCAYRSRTSAYSSHCRQCLQTATYLQHLQHLQHPCKTLHLQLGIDPRRLRTATPCNTLQHPGFTNRHWSTAIANCNNLQHFASLCNTGAFTTQQIANSASSPLGLQSAPPARSTAIRTTTHCSTLHLQLSISPRRLRAERVVHWACNQPLPPRPTDLIATRHD